MDVILKVLEGAKAGTKIAVKKDEFLIGRSQSCHLCAGSSSISRKHCAITRKDAKVFVKDLGSRNGTIINGEKITEEVELSSGDELSVGTLRMLVTITHGITNLKRPKVNSVAEAVERTVKTGDTDIAEDDITKWLLEGPGPSSMSQAASETQTIRMDDTNAVELRKAAEEAAEQELVETGANTDESAEGSDIDPADDKDKKSKKKKPGKLPPIPTEPSSKDSREAAMQALRNWNRRR